MIEKIVSVRINLTSLQVVSSGSRASSLLEMSRHYFSWLFYGYGLATLRNCTKNRQKERLESLANRNNSSFGLVSRVGLDFIKFFNRNFTPPDFVRNRSYRPLDIFESEKNHQTKLIMRAFLKLEKERIEMSKRSNIKKSTRQSKILKFMRLSRNLSQERASLMVGCSESAIGHYETGRMDISELRLRQFLRAYKYDLVEFEEYMNGRPIPTSLKEECIGLLAKLDEVKLKAVHSVLLGFVS